MIVRRERPQDVVQVRGVVASAFRADPRDESLPVEVLLLDALRDDVGWLPAFSLVALDPDLDLEADIVVGHVTCTRGDVGGRPGLGLGPLAVRPDRQRRGTGTALVHAVLGVAEALGEPFVAVLGAPGYYGRFGFRRSSEVGIDPPDAAWAEHFQVRTLSAFTAVRGVFRYAEPFRRL
jgi:putative acetyltransferase